MGEIADVLILGAGPAGCAAAIRARQAGLRVVILDAADRPKRSPGETLHPGIEPILKQLGVLDRILTERFHRHRGIWMEQNGERRFVPYGDGPDGPWMGFQTDRQKFHEILQQAAVDARATLVRNTRPEAVIVSGGRVTGVVANGIFYSATWTVDATGRSAWLAHERNLPQRICSPPLGVRFGWRDEAPTALDGQPSFVFREDGWDWRAPLGQSKCAWVELRIGEPGKRPPAGVDLSWRFRERCAGPGYFLLGDAAATLDPSSSHGVLRALMSGILFGYLADGCKNQAIDELNAAEAYREWLSGQFEHDEMRLREQYGGSRAGRRFMSFFPTRSSNVETETSAG